LSCIVSGLSGSTATAQTQVSVGMGLLAGSTVMLLTVIWGSCVIVGKCDLVDSKAVDSTDTKGYSLTGMSFRFSFSLLITYENQRAGSVTRDFYVRMHFSLFS
jgi:Ca2+/Na+ antiporter